MKRFLTLFGIILAALLVLLGIAGNYMCSYALLPEEHGDDIEGDRAKTESRYPGVMAWYDSLRTHSLIRDTTLTGEGGYKLHGFFTAAQQPGRAEGTAVVVHGYTDNHICFLNLVRMYRDSLNYNVMVPDLHYHGLSEGRAVQMGWLDRLDIKRFGEMAHDIWGQDFMVVHGVSMGAAATMMLSGDELPAYYKAFVEDCGYTSVWDQFAHNLKDAFGLPAFPILNFASLACKIRYGWGFKEASSVARLAHCTRPMLFIHGDADDYVVFENLQKNYDAKVNGYKEMWVAEGSGHAMAYRDHPAEYVARVRAFLKTVQKLQR